LRNILDLKENKFLRRIFGPKIEKITGRWRNTQ
jgi:hypothetical protein